MPVDNTPQTDQRNPPQNKTNSSHGSNFSSSLETTHSSTSDENVTFESIPSPPDSQFLDPPTMASSPKNLRTKDPPKSHLRILNINFQSLRKKGKQLEAVIDSTKPDIILGTETWLDPSVHSSEIISNHLGYNVYRRDRTIQKGNKLKKGGGVMIATRQDLEMEKTTCAKNLEMMSGIIRLSKMKKLILNVFYRPPSEQSESYRGEVNKEFEELFNKNNKNTVIIIGGDLNLPDLDWSSNTITGNQYSNEINQTFLDISAEYGLEQIVDFPTRVDKRTGKESTLDVILTTHPSFKTRCKPLSAVGLSDHDIVLFDTTLNPYRTRPQRRKILLWNKADINGLKEDVRCFTDSFISKGISTIEFMWNDIKDSLHAIIEKRVPSKMTSPRHSHPWINTEIRRAIRRKQRAHAKARKSKKKKDIDRYKRLQKEVKFMIRTASKEFIETTVSNSYSRDCKKFWSYIKSRKQEMSGVPPLKNKEGYLKSDSKAKAEILNDQFKSVFTKEDMNNKPNKGQSPYTPMQNIKVTAKGIEKLLCNLKTNKATGPDQVPAFILKTAAKEIAPALAQLFQHSLDTGEIPMDWKNAWVVPIFKKGEKHQASNYRPVSLTSITCKVLEHIVHSNVMGHFDANRILHDSQHGFRRQRSCETQLVITTHEIARSLAEGKQVDVVLLDFSKAFDKVPHSRLIDKLAYYGVQGTTLQWIHSFLSERKQEVLLEGVHSTPADVTSGVPQGTVLGPLLFLSYINDLPDTVKHSSTKLFADDCLLFKAINNDKDQRTLQSDLSALEQWESDWQMEFNPSKCTVIQFHSGNKIKQASYSLHSETLENVQHSKYLGVTFSHNLSWNFHLDSITQKANRILGFLRRNLNDCSMNVKAASYCSMVRPILEYSAAAWDPYLQKDVNQLETVQRRAARFATNNYHDRTTGCVTSMLQDLQWKSLEERRKTIRLNLLHKMYNKQVDVDVNKFVRLNDPRTRGANRFYQVHAKNPVFYNSFFVRTLRDWNKLPPQLTSKTNNDEFSSCLGGNTISHQTNFM